MFVWCLSYGFKLLQYFELKINCLQLNVLTNKYVCFLNLDVAEEILLGWGSYEVSHSELPLKEPSARSTVGWQPLAATFFEVWRWSTKATVTLCCCCCSVVKLCVTVWDPTDCGTPGLPVPNSLPEFAQVHVHWIRDATLCFTHSMSELQQEVLEPEIPVWPGPHLWLPWWRRW